MTGTTHDIRVMLPARYNLDSLRRAIGNPRMFLGELNTAGLRVNERWHRRFRSQAGVHVVEEDWDNLIILDGCRYDLFTETHELDGDLEQRTSQGAESWEFLQRNFATSELHDVVYVSANPFVTRLKAGTFHATIPLYTDGWDSDLQTVRPDTVVEATREAHHSYPNKRLVVHFMQPHFPFIGEQGRQLDPQVSETLGDTEAEYPQIWSAKRYRMVDIPRETLWELYRENLEVVLPHVTELLRELEGLSVVTSDHGNLVGERTSPVPVRGYGHAFSLRMPGLVSIPWLVVDGGGRRETVSEPPERRDEDEELVGDRLRALGYRE